MPSIQLNDLGGSDSTNYTDNASIGMLKMEVAKKKEVYPDQLEFFVAGNEDRLADDSLVATAQAQAQGGLFVLTKPLNTLAIDGLGKMRINQTDLTNDDNLTDCVIDKDYEDTVHIIELDLELDVGAGTGSLPTEYFTALITKLPKHSSVYLRELSGEDLNYAKWLESVNNLILEFNGSEDPDKNLILFYDKVELISNLEVGDPKFEELIDEDDDSNYILKYTIKSLRNDKEVVLAAVQKNGRALQYASAELKADKEVVLAAVQQDGCALQYASAELKADKEVVLAAVQQDGDALYYASAELQADKEVVLAAVQQDGCAIGYASEAIQADKGVVMAAVQQNGVGPSICISRS